MKILFNFQDIYSSYSTDVYRFALWLSGDRDEAEDITSKTFVRALIRKSAIRTETLKAYLFTIARHVYLERLRKEKNQAPLMYDHPDPAPEPDQIVEFRSQLRRIQQILRLFPETDRTAFILRVHLELPYAEIARILELSLSAVKVKVHRIRKKLIADCLDKEVF
ncbi:MAG: RNA polymerase sigma factor [Candidatus Aminicenantes bacterium]|nr:RNA polymerase sigma factor [Candidatus Aminicenantes bacterium]